MNIQHHMKHVFAFTPAAIAVLLITGCASLPDVDSAPKLRATQNTDFVSRTTGQWPAATWWHDLHDAQLDQLITQALKDSPSVDVAQARVLQAQAVTDNASAERGMKLDANASLNRTKYSLNSFYPPPIGGKSYYDGEASLNFSYDFDFWGRNRKALQAALGRETASRADAAGAAAALSASVASSYYQWQVLNQRIMIQEQITAYQQHLVEIEIKRMKAGLSSGNNVAPLRANAALPEQTLVQLKAQRDQVRSQLKSLVASGQDFSDLTTHPLPQLNGDLPSTLSLDLIARRADTAAARDRVQASLTDVESARAAFYPDINLSASAGFSSLSIAKLFESSSEQAGIMPAIHLPLFDAGRLRAGLNVNRAEVALAVAQYNQSVQNAVSEINDAELRVQGANNELVPLQHQIQARQHTLDNTKKLIKAGLQDGHALAGAELLKANLQDQEIVRQGRALQAHIDLIKALGGGYDDAKNTPSQSSNTATITQNQSNTPSQ
jgi:multidrug efflux system outer membrane protein